MKFHHIFILFRKCDIIDLLHVLLAFSMFLSCHEQEHKTHLKRVISCGCKCMGSWELGSHLRHAFNSANSWFLKVTKPFQFSVCTIPIPIPQGSPPSELILPRNQISDTINKKYFFLSQNSIMQPFKFCNNILHLKQVISCSCKCMGTGIPF